MTGLIDALHNAPRFGHTRSIAYLASTEQEDHDDYVKGVRGFAVFLMTFLFTWGVLLVYLKFAKVDLGCANGGGVIDIAELRKIPRDQRPLSKTMAKRAWRLQTVFLLCGLGIPIATMLFLKNGLFQMMDSLQDTAETVSDVETLTYEGIRIVDTLTNVRKELVEAELSSKLNLEGYCPKLVNSTLFGDIGFERSTEDIDDFLSDMDIFIDGHAKSARDGFHKVLGSTEQFDKFMATIYNMDWMPKMFIVILNVLNGFMMVGAFMSKQNVAFFPFHCMLSYLIVPAFSIVLILAITSSSIFGVASVMNADFCHGGEVIMLEIFDHRGIDSQDMLYQTFMYYVDQCSTVNPLSMFAPDEQEFLATFDKVSTIISLSDNYNSTFLNYECGADVTPVLAAVDILADNLGELSSSVRRVEALTSCFKVRPILNKLFYGSMCTGSVEGLTWMFGAMFAIAVLSLVMLSTRASLYNAVVKAPRKEESEREWWEYLDFMAQFYDDTEDWKYQPSPKNKGSGHGDLEQVGSFGTDLTATDTFEENTDRGDDDSEKISLFIEDKIPLPDRYTPIDRNVQVKKPNPPSSIQERRRSSEPSRESQAKTPDKWNDNERVTKENQLAENPQGVIDAEIVPVVEVEVGSPNWSKRSARENNAAAYKSDNREKHRNIKDVPPVELEEKRVFSKSKTKGNDMKVSKRKKKRGSSRDKHIVTKSSSDKQQELRPDRKIAFTEEIKPSTQTVQKADVVEKTEQTTSLLMDEKERMSPGISKTPDHRGRRRRAENTSEGMVVEEDEEMTPFFSPVASCVPVQTPPAPRKNFASLQRTRLGKFA